MTTFLRLAFLVSLAPVASFAGSWSGVLVDSDCYARAQSNTKQGTHPGSMGDQSVRRCAPTVKSTSFAVVQQDGTSLKLDSNGNQKAQELIHKEGNLSQYKVSVTGDTTRDTVTVATISISK